MTPSAEQIAQWEKEAEELYPDNAKINDFRPMHERMAYMVARQAAFDEYSKSFEKDEDYKAMQQELAQLKLYTKSLEIYGTEKQRDDLAEERTKHFARVAVLEGLLREVLSISNLSIVYTDQGKYFPSIGNDLHGRITSALSGTEKQKPNL